MKKATVIGLLSLSSLVFAGTKTFKVEFTSEAKAGSTQFTKGVYTVKVVGDKAVFTDQHSKSVEVPVKLENGSGKKFEYTSVEATHQGDTEVVKVIHVGGSNTSLEF